MLKKYVYFIPQGGINDCFVNIYNTIQYCKKYNRILLLDMVNSIYKINMSDYFIIRNTGVEIIYDKNIINTIIKNTKNTIYPPGIESIRDNLISNNLNIKYQYKKPFYTYINIPLELPNKRIDNNILIHSRCGGGDGSIFFINNIFFTEIIKKYLSEKIKVYNNYLCIHVRSTDISSDYIGLYNNNKNYIHSYKNIYLCTDNKIVYNYFLHKKINIKCFTTFSNNSSRNLHTSDVNNDTKIKDILFDIFLATNSSSFLSNSKGGFTKLLKKCYLKKTIINNKLK